MSNPRYPEHSGGFEEFEGQFGKLDSVTEDDADMLVLLASGLLDTKSSQTYYAEYAIQHPNIGEFKFVATDEIDNQRSEDASTKIVVSDYSLGDTTAEQRLCELLFDNKGILRGIEPHVGITIEEAASRIMLLAEDLRMVRYCETDEIGHMMAFLCNTSVAPLIGTELWRGNLPYDREEVSAAEAIQAIAQYNEGFHIHTSERVLTVNGESQFVLRRREFPADKAGYHQGRIPVLSIGYEPYAAFAKGIDYVVDHLGTHHLVVRDDASTPQDWVPERIQADTPPMLSLSVLMNKPIFDVVLNNLITAAMRQPYY